MDRYTILIVDDEPANLSYLGQMLEDRYDLLFAASGPVALEAVAAHKTDLVLLDIMMPDMDGYEVCRRMKRDTATREIPVIFVTALSDSHDEAEGFLAGAVDYITKPAKPEVVRARVHTHLSLETARQKILEQNKTLKEQARQLFEFGTQKKEQVEKMAQEVSKAMEAITRKQEEMETAYAGYMKSLSGIMQAAAGTDGDIQKLMAMIRDKIWDEEQQRMVKGFKLPDREVTIYSLRQGMIISREIIDRDDRCLLTSGTMVTEPVIKSLMMRHKSGKIGSRVHIIS